MRYMAVVEKCSSSYGAFVSDLPGCITVGESTESKQYAIAPVSAQSIRQA